MCENYTASEKSRKLSLVFNSVFQRSCQFDVYDIVGGFNIRASRRYLLDTSHCHFRRNLATGMFRANYGNAHFFPL